MNKIRRILAAAGIASALVCMSATASMAAPTTSPAASATQTAVAPGYQSQPLGQLTSAYPATGRDVPEQVKAQILADLAPQLELSYTFSKDATYLIWYTSTYGDAIAAICSNYAPSWASPICDVIQYSAQYIANLGEPGYHDCLNVYLETSWPPAGVQYVYC